VQNYHDAGVGAMVGYIGCGAGAWPSPQGKVQ